jgi:hypothetical protein
MTPELRQKLALAEAEAARFNSSKKPLEAKAGEVYKSSFNLQNELELLKKNNIIDKDWADKTLEEAKMKDPAKMEQEALKAVGKKALAAQMDTSPLKRTEEEEEEGNKAEEEQSEEEAIEKKPLTEEEKFTIVVDEVKSRYGENAISLDILKQWKNRYGKIFILDMSDYIFIYRYLSRQEWRQLMADPTWEKLDELKREERIVGKCLLFPQFTIEQKAMLPAGAYSMLSEQVKIQSMFLNATQVASITMQI